MAEPNAQDLDHLELLRRVSPQGVRQPKRITTRAAKRRCLLMLLALFALAGFISPLTLTMPTFGRAISVVFTFVFLVPIFSWCIYDSRERSYHINLFLRVLIVLCPILGVSVYLLLTRGFRGVASILLMCLFVGAGFAVAVLCGIITCWLFGIAVRVGF